MLTFKRVNIAIVCLLIVFLVFTFQFKLSYWFITFVPISWLLLTALGSFNIQWNYFLVSKNHNYQIDKNYIALTFDDGPHPEFTPKALSLLKKFNAKATFFLIGKNTEKHPELVKQIIAEGHDIGSHSYLHSNNYGFLSRNEVTKDIMKSQKIMFDITNLRVQFFRPPFGVTNPNIARAVKNLSLKTFGWSVRSYDTVAKKSAIVFKKITTNLKRGDVVLLHDTSELSVEVLEKTLVHLKAKNIKSVTLSTLFNIDSYGV